MKKTLVIHPFLLAIYPVFFIFSHNIGQIPFVDIFEPIITTLLYTLTGWYILWLILKDGQKSGLVVSLFLVLFFSYGHFRNFLNGFWPVMLISLLSIAVFILGFYFTKKSKKSFIKGTKILNAISVILLLLCLSNIIIYKLNAKGRWAQDENIGNLNTNPTTAIKTQGYPDIYFIILDAYVRSDILLKMYDFDNCDFLDFLRKKGFYIADRASANYCQTGQSVGSCLNLVYLTDWAKKVGQNNIDRRPLSTIISNNYVRRFLKKHGYTTVSFATDCYLTDLRDSDIYLQSGVSINQFKNTLKNITPIPDIMSGRDKGNTLDTYREMISYTLDNLENVPKLEQTPKFIFAHIEIPHPPFVFGPDGQAINIEQRFSTDDADWLIHPGRFTKKQYQKLYRDQVKFVNKRIKKIVEKILNDSKRPPIILLFGDHGPRSEVIWEDPKKTNMEECMSILNAYYLPDGGESSLYPEISPVNTFRIVFNHYFGGKFDLLPDENFYCTARYPYKFHNVTSRVQGKDEKKTP